MARSFVQRHFRCNPEQQATQDRSANRGRGAVGQSSGAQGRPSVFTPRRPNAERRREAGKERAGMRVCRPGIRPAPRGSLRPPTGPQRRQPASRTDPAPRRKPGQAGPERGRPVAVAEKPRPLRSSRVAWPTKPTRRSVRHVFFQADATVLAGPDGPSLPSARLKAADTLKSCQSTC